MNSHIERWAKNKVSDGWRQSIANTPVKDYGITVRSGKDRGDVYTPAFIEKIEQAFQNLTSKEKEVIQLEYFEPGTQLEKAISINISHQLFRDRLYRARKKLNSIDKCH